MPANIPLTTKPLSILKLRTGFFMYISNRGEGIPATEQENVFEQF